MTDSICLLLFVAVLTQSPCTAQSTPTGSACTALLRRLEDGLRGTIINGDHSAEARLYHPQGVLVFAGGQSVSYGTAQIQQALTQVYANTKVVRMQCQPSVMVCFGDYAVEEAICTATTADGNTQSGSVNWIFKRLNGQYLLYHDQTDPR